jgi:hypothetical protein
MREHGVLDRVLLIYEAAAGAPRPMKMGTIVLPWHYDAVAWHAIRRDNQRRTAILRYASWALFLPISPSGPVTLR